MFERHQYSSSILILGWATFILINKLHIKFLLVPKWKKKTNKKTTPKNSPKPPQKPKKTHKTPTDCTWNLRISTISITSTDVIISLLKNLFPIFCGVSTDQLQNLPWLAEIICKKPGNSFQSCCIILKLFHLLKIQFPFFDRFSRVSWYYCERNSNTDEQSKPLFLLYQTT